MNEVQNVPCQYFIYTYFQIVNNSFAVLIKDFALLLHV